MNQRKAGAVLSYVYLALTFLIGIFYTPILLHQLGKAEYGVYSVASSAISFLAILDLGFNQTMIRYISKYKALHDEENEQRTCGMFLIFYTVIAIVSLIAGVILYFNLDLFFQGGFEIEEIARLKIIFVILLVNLVVSFPLGIVSSIISANEGFVYLRLVDIISSVLTHAAILCALFMGYKSITMAVITTVVSISLKIFTVFYGNYKYKIHFIFRDFDRAIMKEIFVFSFFIFLNIVIDQLYANTDRFILGAFCSSAAVTTYSIGVQFSTYFTQFSTSISGVFLPKVTKLITVEETMDEVSKLFIRIGRIQFILLSFLMSGFVVFGRQFISCWVGEYQMAAHGIALAVIVPSLIPLSQNIGISVLRAMNMHRFRSIIYLFIAIVNVVLSVPLAIRYGGLGAASATALATCVGQICVMNWFYSKKIGLDIRGYWKEISKIIVWVIVEGVLGVGLNYLLAGTGWMNLIVKCIIYVVFFVPIAWKLILNEYEKDIFFAIIRKIKR